MSKNSPVIVFEGYRVIHIEYSCNPAYEFPAGEVNYKFNFNKALEKIDEHHVQENLRINVFHGADEYENSPYKLSASMAGIFSCEDEFKEPWESNMVAIMYPYLRSLVSTISSNSGRPSITLPTVNVAAMFRDKKTNEDPVQK